MKITLKFAVLAALLVFYIVIILVNVFGGRGTFEGFEDEKVKEEGMEEKEREEGMEEKDREEGLENKDDDNDLTNAIVDSDDKKDTDKKKKAQQE